jgi:16S rRNA G527 N7-methylase RsmG
VEVLHARVEKVRDRPAPDFFLARFFKDLRLLAAWTRRWRQPGTRYMIFAGAEDEPQASVYDLKLQDTHALGAGKVAHEYLAT